MATQYAHYEHGFVLVQGTVDTTLQPLCTRPDCVNSAMVPPEAAAHHAAAGLQQPAVSEVAAADVQITATTGDVFYEAEESPPPNDGYTNM